jgi:hypothetical protein
MIGWALGLRVSSNNAKAQTFVIAENAYCQVGAHDVVPECFKGFDYC